MLTLEIKDFIKDDLNIHIADLVLTGGGYTGQHNHDFYEFFIVIKGEFDEIYNDKKTKIQERTFHLIKPEDTHSFVITDKSSKDISILRNIAVRKEYFESLVKKSGINEQVYIGDYNYIDEITFSNFKNKSQLLIKRDAKMNPQYIFESLFSDILIDIANKSKNKLIPPNWLIKTFNEMKKKENYIEGLKKFIELSGKSQEHLTRELKKYYNQTPTDYINLLRFTEASRLLIGTEDNITDIIFQCGFTNISYFNRGFKKMFNVTPKKYREINKKIFNFTSI